MPKSSARKSQGKSKSPYRERRQKRTTGIERRNVQLTLNGQPAALAAVRADGCCCATAPAMCVVKYTVTAEPACLKCTRLGEGKKKVSI